MHDLTLSKETNNSSQKNLSLEKNDIKMVMKYVVIYLSTNELVLMQISSSGHYQSNFLEKNE